MLHLFTCHGRIMPLGGALFFFFFLRWSGGAKVSCILRHWGVQLILAYSWARPAILVAGKGRGNVFISSVSSLSFLFLFLPCPSLSSLLLSLPSLFSLSLGDKTKLPTRVEGLLNPITEGPGFNPRRGRQHFFVEIDHEIFSTVSLSLLLILEGQLSVSGQRMCTILVNCLEN